MTCPRCPLTTEHREDGGACLRAQLEQAVDALRELAAEFGECRIWGNGSHCVNALATMRRPCVACDARAILARYPEAPKP